MVRTLAAPSAPRRRFLSGLAASGLAIVLAGCDRTLPIGPTPLTTSTVRRTQPAPLEPAAPPEVPATRLDAVFGRVVRLEGVTIERDTIRRGEYLRIWLHWQSVAESQEDLRSVGCDILTLGQYLRPSAKHLPVEEFVKPEVFHELEREGLALGFKFVAAGPLVRSSYKAGEFFVRNWVS